jgi:RNA polymerase sigma-70 factor (ECF subfamily)
LYEAHAPRIYSAVLMPKLGDPALAEDALAETFRSAFERLASYEPRGTSIYFWFVRIATNKALDLHRARSAKRRAIVNLEQHLTGLDEPVPAADSHYELREQYERRRTRLQTCLQALNPRYRRAIELRFYEERERDECAVMLEVTVATFDVVLLRALRALAKQWESLAENAKEPSSERY